MAEILHIENVSAGSISTSSPKKTKDNFLKRIILRYRAKRQAKRILDAIGQADQIHRGRKQGKSYDQFLEEL